MAPAEFYPSNSPVPHWIGGRPVPPASRTQDVFNPATGKVARQVGLASAAEVARAVESAAAAGGCLGQHTADPACPRTQSLPGTDESPSR